MSFFGGGGPSRAEQQRQAMVAARAEMEFTQDMFQKMTRMCFRKCVPQLKEVDLNVAEMTCMDRCVGKFLAAHRMTGEDMQKYNEQLSAASVGAAGQQQQ